MNLFDTLSDEDSFIKSIFIKYEPLIGDIYYYNPENKIYSYAIQLNLGDEQLIPIGIIMHKNVNDTYIALLKNYLSATGEGMLFTEKVNSKNISFYLKDLFNRYALKYKKESNILNNINFYIPEIQLLDILYFNLNIFKKSLININGEEKTNSFFERFYQHGILAQYKNKYYQWIIKDNKREINQLLSGNIYEFLPAFNIKIE